MAREVDLLIVGAGPFGLALGAYARQHKIDHLLVGRPMGFWRENMPEGMYLRSASDWHLDPRGTDTIERYLALQGRVPADIEPISLQQYLDYTSWFQQQQGFEIIPDFVQRLDRSGDGERRFAATLEDGSVIHARQVALAIGFQYFANRPPDVIAQLPAGSYAHTCDLVDLRGMRGKRCLILGGRQSAFEWAALLHEAGAAAVHVSHRHPSPAFAAADWSWVPPLVDTIAADPAWFRRLPAEEKKAITDQLWGEGRLKVEPWLEERVRQETVTLWPQTALLSCDRQPGGELIVRLDNGTTLIVDQIILATGYKVDLTRVPFLTSGDLSAAIATSDGFPVLDEHFQTTVPGLFMTSMAATRDFGPFFAFTVSARASALVIGAAVERALAARSGQVVTPTTGTGSHPDA